MWHPEFDFSGGQPAQYRRLESASGPQYQWGVLEDRTATMGQALSARGCGEMQVNPDVMSLWFEGIELSFTQEPPVVVLPDYPSVLGDRFRAAVELGRLAALGKILTNPPEGDRSGGGAGLSLGGVEEKLWQKRVEEKSRAEVRLDFGRSLGVCSS